MLFDTHCHAYWDGLAGRDAEVRANMNRAGVARTVQIGTDERTNPLALAVARAWGDGHWATAGLHPADCQDFFASSLGGMMERLEAHIRANRDKIVAVGECGLDHHHLTPGNEVAQKAVQRAFFSAQAALAKKLELPLVIHTRDAAEDTLACLREFGVTRAVIHCFCEDWDFARAAMEISPGIVFAFGGTMTYKKSDAIRDVARRLPLDRILLETDAPFLAPQAVRGATCEPAFVRHSFDALRALRPEPESQLEAALWENSCRFFGVAP